MFGGGDATKPNEPFPDDEEHGGEKLNVSVDPGDARVWVFENEATGEKHTFDRSSLYKRGPKRP